MQRIWMVEWSVEKRLAVGRYGRGKSGGRRRDRILRKKVQGERGRKRRKMVNWNMKQRVPVGRYVQ
jgi:hypothetical protein